MKVLFFMQLKGFLRHFEPTLGLMAARGDMIHIAFDQVWPRDDPVSRRMLEDHEGISIGPSPPYEGADRWRILAEDLRAGLDYLLYLEPWFQGSPGLRERMSAAAPHTLRRLGESGLLGGRRRLAAATQAFRMAERNCPPRKEVRAFIADQEPDVVLVTPLVHSKSPQPDYVRAARELGIPSGLCVASWDNFTTKGRIHEQPDFVTVWNTDQAEEAQEMHGVPADRIHVTGAQTFDHWFDWRPRATREDFCREAGLSPELPFILFVGSSPFVAGRDEPAFVREWAAGIRDAAKPQPLQILVRPYPGSEDRWREAEFPDPGAGVGTWPLEPAVLGDPRSRAGFFDSIYH
jgi:hypothetical protein